MDTLDTTIQKVFPLLAAPSQTTLSEAQACGMRYIATSKGLMREISLPWIRIVHTVARSVVNLPYGELRQSCELLCSRVPKGMWKQLRQDAVAAMPNEMAAVLVWNEVTDMWRYALRNLSFASRAALNYERFQLEEGEHIVVDLHSHGDMHAFFSAQDNQDDRDSMRFSGVIGRVTTNSPEFVLRLSMPGVRWNAALTANGVMEVEI
jgi:PRTRC genetic system protein A